MRATSSVMVLGMAAAALFAAVSVRAQDAPGGGPGSVAIADEGQQIYEQICQACHLADARGGGDAGAVIPALAGNAKLADAKYMLEILNKGRGGMPWFNDILNPAQIAAVTNYVRTHFNSYTDRVTEADAVAAGSPSSSASACVTCQ